MVVAGETEEEIVLSATVEMVVAFLIQKQLPRCVPLGSGGSGSLQGLAKEDVPIVAAVEPVVARPAVQDVLAKPAVSKIVIGTGVDDIVAAEALDLIVPIIAGRGCADDEVATATGE